MDSGTSVSLHAAKTIFLRLMLAPTLSRCEHTFIDVNIPLNCFYQLFGGNFYILFYFVLMLHDKTPILTFDCHFITSVPLISRHYIYHMKVHYVNNAITYPTV